VEHGEIIVEDCDEEPFGGLLDEFGGEKVGGGYRGFWDGWEERVKAFRRSRLRGHLASAITVIYQMRPWISPCHRSTHLHPHPQLGFSLAPELIFELPEDISVLLCVLDCTFQLEVLQVWPRAAQDLNEMNGGEMHCMIANLGGQ
jgi:hypothetical protein